jgi:ubiquinone/menaquinone biosynthesis C-methylase UbiE
MLQTDAVPANLYLQVDDLNRRYAFATSRRVEFADSNLGSFTFESRYFDLVHSQMMATGIHTNRWSQYLREMFRVTRGGGWCQMVELYFNIQSDNGSLTPGPPLFTL